MSSSSTFTFKNLVTVISIAFAIQFFILSGRLKSFYEKPDQTLKPLGCVFSKCLGPSMKCIVDSKCRKTIGEFEFKMILYKFIEA